LVFVASFLLYVNSLPDYVVDTDGLDKFKTLIDEFWFYSVINQNYLEPEADHRSRFRDTDIEVQAPESVFLLMLWFNLCSVLSIWQVSIFIDSILTCPERTSLVLCN